jgi:hypothetical protein
MPVTTRAQTRTQKNAQTRTPSITIRALGVGAYGAVFRVQFGSTAFAMKVPIDPTEPDIQKENHIMHDIARRAPPECKKYFVAPVPASVKQRLISRSNSSNGSTLFETILTKIFKDLPTTLYAKGFVPSPSFTIPPHGNVYLMEALDDAIEFRDLATAVKQRQQGHRVSQKLAFFLKPEILKSILEQIPKAFVCLFKLGWIHTDAHDGNIMIVPVPPNSKNKEWTVQVKIIDYGLFIMASTPLGKNVHDKSAIHRWFLRETSARPNVQNRNWWWPNMTWVNGKFFAPVKPPHNRSWKGTEMLDQYRTVLNYAANSPKSTFSLQSIKNKFFAHYL